MTPAATSAATLATLELQYFRAVSLYRRRSYEQCAEVCNALLQAGHDNNVQIFAKHEQQQQQEEAQQEQQQTEHESSQSYKYGSHLQRIGPRRRRGEAAKDGGTGQPVASIMPTWLMEGVWQLKMRALTQRVYLDDLEVDDADDGGERNEWHVAIYKHKESVKENTVLWSRRSSGSKLC